MNEPSLDATHFVCTRWFAAPPSLVFRAFTEPALLERWFCPSADVAVQVDSCDARPGGRYRFVFAFPDGRLVPVLGEYLTVTPPERLAFTWTWEPPDSWAGIVTVVTVDFSAKGGGTQVAVRHERFASVEMKTPHEAGWLSTLDRLGRLLAAVRHAGDEPASDGALGA